jgi:integrase
MARRANGEGSIYKLPEGGYKVCVSVATSAGLKRISRRAKTRAEAAAILQELRATAPVSRAARNVQTVGDYLAWWLAAVVEPRLARSTHAVRQHAVTKHIAPRIGQARLSRLDSVHVHDLLAAMAEDGVGGRMAQVCFATLRLALNYAVAPLGLIVANPCNGISQPKHRAEEIKPFEAAEVRRILAACEGTRWHAPIALLFLCGLRQGELFGLRCRDVDLATATIQIVEQVVEVSGSSKAGSLKTSHSTRSVSMPTLAVEAVRQHLAIRAAEGHGDDARLFCAIEGGYQSRSNFRRRVWEPLLDSLNLERRGPHHARHTFATLALSHGAPLAVVSRSLGHSTQAITLQLYSHYLPSRETAAADAMQSLLE